MTGTFLFFLATTFLSAWCAHKAVHPPIHDGNRDNLLSLAMRLLIVRSVSVIVALVLAWFSISTGSVLLRSLF